jgi:hypothetical protein
MNRWLYLILMEGLRSDYPSRPDALMFAKVIMEMVAALDPGALIGLDSQFISPEQLDGMLRALIETLQKSFKQPSAAPQ